MEKEEFFNLVFLVACGDGWVQKSNRIISTISFNRQCNNYSGTASEDSDFVEKEAYDDADGFGYTRVESTYAHPSPNPMSTANFRS